MSGSFLTSFTFILAFCLVAKPSVVLQPVSNATSNVPLSSNGISPVSPADDGTYYTIIKVGLINFRATLDTGSSDLWLASTSCTTPACSQVPKYPLSYASPTFASVQNNATTFSVSYADGTHASGFVAMESITVSNVTAPNQAFGLVTHSNVTLVDQTSGVLGLGFSRLSEIDAIVPNAPSFIASLSQRGIIEYPIFGLSLARTSMGSLALGAIDASIVQNFNDIVWNDVVPFSPLGTRTNTSGYMFWAIRMTSFAVNKSTLATIPTYPGPTGDSSIAMLDVGTTGIYGPYQDVTRLYAQFPGSRLVDESGQWVIPCSSSATLTFSFGEGTAFVLQPTDYIMGPTESNPRLCLSWPRASQPNAYGIDWQLGAPFLRTVYSVYHFGIDYVQPPMIGLYPRRNSSAPVEPPAVVTSFFSAMSATLPTTLPNFPLPTLTHATPPYTFNTSVPATLGEIVDSELATSTYPPMAVAPAIDATALPKVFDQYTLVGTDAQGQVVTSTYHLMEPSVILGEPPGWNGARSLRAPVAMLLSAVYVGVWIFY